MRWPGGIWCLIYQWRSQSRYDCRRWLNKRTSIKQTEISADVILKYFSYFLQKIGFDISCKLSPKDKICMKWHPILEKNNMSSPAFALSMLKSAEKQPTKSTSLSLCCLWHRQHWHWFLKVLIFLSHLLVAGCDIGVRFSVRPPVHPSVRPSVNIYVDVRHLCQS